MRTPEWYANKVESIRKRKRKLTSLPLYIIYEGDYLDGRKKREIKDDLKREQRAAKRGEKQDMKKMIDEELRAWNEKRNK